MRIIHTKYVIYSGLLGGHVSVLALKENDPSRISWYKGQLLNMAVDLGNRLLPAFNTSTGLPFPRINLHTGKPSPLVSSFVSPLLLTRVKIKLGKVFLLLIVGS